MSEVEDDPEFNPLIDAEDEDESDEEIDEDSELLSIVLELRQVVVNQRDEIDTLKDGLASLETRIDEKNSQIDILRNNLRRIRFQSDTQGALNRRNNAFFDAARRKFLEGWNGDMQVIQSADLEHLAFLSHVLDLPAFTKDEV